MNNKEKIKKLKIREKQEKRWRLLKRLQCIRFRLERKKYKEIIKTLWVSHDTIANWVKKYNFWWIEELLSTENKWKPWKLWVKELEQIRQKNKTTGFNTAKDAKKYIEDNFWIKYCLSNVLNILKKTKI